MNKTIYKKDTSGKIRFITYSVEDNILVQESGVLGSDNTVVHEKECHAKNIGRSNETTPEEQAIREMESKIKDKLDKEYFETEEEAKNNKVILPMLAKVYQKEIDKKAYKNVKLYTQPKLDGMRCLAFISNGNVELRSRDNKIIDSSILGHIVKGLEKLPDCILDGELYAHGYSFQEVMSKIKSYKPGETEIIRYHIYDMVKNEPYYKRKNSLDLILKFAPPGACIINCPTREIPVYSNFEDSKNAIKGMHQQYLTSHYEGTIIRIGEGTYEQNKRSKYLLKYKDFQDIKAILVGVKPNEADSTMGTPQLEYTHEDGLTVEFDAGTKLSHEERKDLLQNAHNYIGKTCEIRFFEWTDARKPRHPVLVGFIN